MTIYRLKLLDGVPSLDLTASGSVVSFYTVTAAEAMPTETWTHIAAVREGAILKLLVNNTSVATTPFTGSVFDGAVCMLNLLRKQIAQHPTPAAHTDVLVVQGVDGIIDELRYANADKRAVSECELYPLQCAVQHAGKSITLTQVSTTYTYNERNQLVTETTGDSVKTYTYDNNGNNIVITEVVDSTTITTETMEYDGLNRMTSYTGPRGTESFTYRGAEWHRYTADGQTFLYDEANVLADIANDQISAFYVTPGIDANMSITTGGNTYYYSQDGLNSVRTLTDSTAGIVNNHDYLPFGSAYSPNTNVTKEQYYTYTGKNFNAVSPLMYYRYRNYNTGIGNFNMRDPLGYYANPAGNLYAYITSRSTMSRDPYGLKPCCSTPPKWHCCEEWDRMFNLAGYASLYECVSNTITDAWSFEVTMAQLSAGIGTSVAIESLGSSAAAATAAATTPAAAATAAATTPAAAATAATATAAALSQLMIAAVAAGGAGSIMIAIDYCLEWHCTASSPATKKCDAGGSYWDTWYMACPADQILTEDPTERQEGASFVPIAITFPSGSSDDYEWIKRTGPKQTPEGAYY